MSEAAQLPAKVEPWRQRLIRSLLYGRNVDRAEKARARVGFTIEDIATGEKKVMAHVRLQSRFRVGRYGVDPAAVDSVGVPAVARALGIAEQAGDPNAQSTILALRGRLDEQRVVRWRPASLRDC